MRLLDSVLQFCHEYHFVPLLEHCKSYLSVSNGNTVLQHRIMQLLQGKYVNYWLEATIPHVSAGCIQIMKLQVAKIVQLIPISLEWKHFKLFLLLYASYFHVAWKYLQDASTIASSGLEHIIANCFELANKDAQQVMSLFGTISKMVRAIEPHSCDLIHKSTFLYVSWHQIIALFDLSLQTIKVEGVSVNAERLFEISPKQQLPRIIGAFKMAKRSNIRQFCLKRVGNVAMHHTAISTIIEQVHTLFASFDKTNPWVRDILGHFAVFANMNCCKTYGKFK